MAAGINPVDYKLRSHGTIGDSLPAVLGRNGAGVVERTGRAVTRARPGDEVYFCDGGFGPTPGTYQELKVLDERYVAAKPKRLSFVEAAAAPLSPPGKRCGNGHVSKAISSSWFKQARAASGTCRFRLRA